MLRDTVEASLKEFARISSSRFHSRSVYERRKAEMLRDVARVNACLAKSQRRSELREAAAAKRASAAAEAAAAAAETATAKSQPIEPSLPQAVQEAPAVVDSMPIAQSTQSPTTATEQSGGGLAGGSAAGAHHPYVSASSLLSLGDADAAGTSKGPFDPIDLDEFFGPAPFQFNATVHQAGDQPGGFDRRGR